MTKRSLRRSTTAVIAVYMAVIAIGVILRMTDVSSANVLYSTYKDLIGLFIAIPAAYLAFSFQRRASYLHSLHALWRTLLEGVHSARSFTYLEGSTSTEYSHVLNQLSVALDEVRGVFKNIPFKGTPCWYPFEPLHQIHDTVRDLGWGEKATTVRRETARAQIESMWEPVREQMLLEFDR